jgi:hypothetical protein
VSRGHFRDFQRKWNFNLLPASYPAPTPKTRSFLKFGLACSYSFTTVAKGVSGGGAMLRPDFFAKIKSLIAEIISL